MGANGEILGYNLYAYCGNNPVNRDDPLGKAWMTTLLIGAGVSAVSGISSGIASVMSGGSFRAGFVAGIVAGAIGYATALINPTSALLQVGARMLSSVISNFGTMLLNGDDLTANSVATGLTDVVMDGVYSSIGYYYNPFPDASSLLPKLASNMFNAGMDGFSDVAETYLFATNSQTKAGGYGSSGILAIGGLLGNGGATFVQLY